MGETHRLTADWEDLLLSRPKPLGGGCSVSLERHISTWQCIMHVVGVIISHIVT